MQTFETRHQLEEWLKHNHDQQPELWIRNFRKQTGKPTVIWEDCVLAAIAWGWIDGQRKSLDEESFLQRLTPRRARSNWSKRNTEHAERLIASGQMQPPGLAQVEAARNDGRWANAYAGSAEMTIPEDFLLALKKAPVAAKRCFETLDRRNLFVIYHRLHTAKRPETRLKRISGILEQLARGETFH